MENNALSELFARNPFNLDEKVDLPAIITHMRLHQSQFEHGVKPPPKPKPKSQKTLDLLKDLGL